MADLRIFPKHLSVGDVITSDPRLDITVHDLEADEFGDVIVNPAGPNRAFIHADQTITVRSQR